jgi:hypothetical protein
LTGPSRDGHHQDQDTERTTVSTQSAIRCGRQEALPSDGMFTYPETDR